MIAIARNSVRLLGVAAIVAASADCVGAPPSAGAWTQHSPVSLGAMPRAADVFPLCPSAIHGAETDVQDLDGGVVVDVTANDAATAARIRDRATGLLSAIKDAEHADFDAAKRGGLAHCPVVVEDTHVTTVGIDRGVRFVVLTNPAEVAWVRREARARFAELRVPTIPTSPALAHCPCALPSAETTVRDTVDGIVVTVVSRDDDVARVIRGRAWHLAEQSKHIGPLDDDRSDGADVTDVPHVPHCPIFAEATSIEATDVPGGSEITMRPDDRADLARLRRIVRARASALP